MINLLFKWSQTSSVAGYASAAPVLNQVRRFIKAFCENVGEERSQSNFFNEILIMRAALIKQIELASHFNARNFVLEEEKYEELL